MREAAGSGKAMDQAGTADTADIREVMAMIPHRYPFLMIDRVVDIRPGEACVGIKNVSINEAHFQGHFPAEPVMPGVLIVEAMAQTAAVLVVRTLGDHVRGKLVYFMSIDRARFRAPVTPGDTVRIAVRILRYRGAVWRFSAEAFVDGRIVAEGVCSALIRDLDDPEPR